MISDSILSGLQSVSHMTKVSKLQEEYVSLAAQMFKLYAMSWVISTLNIQVKFHTYPTAYMILIISATTCFHLYLVSCSLSKVMINLHVKTIKSWEAP